MTLTIDNFDSAGACDYTAALDAEHPPRVVRKLNQPAEMRAWLLAVTSDFIVPRDAARIVLADGATRRFTGYLSAPPTYEYLGWGERGPMYRYALTATSDELLLDRKTLPRRAPFVQRTAGSALKQLAEDLAPGAFDTSAIADVVTLATYSSDPQKRWSEHAAALALLGRAAYRAHDGALVFAPVGTQTHTLAETSPDFSPDSLKLVPAERLVNDVTVVGRMEPRAYVKDYFLGDGLSLYFSLSEAPFTRSNRTVLEEEYKDATLRPARWTVGDPGGAIAVSGGKLQISGGAGDGQTTVRFVEPIELGGAVVLQHGEAAFSAASDGVLGGLYAGAVAIANCLAGFRVTPSGAQSVIAALISGVTTGPTITTVAGHRYALTTRVYSSEIYRSRQTFHSASHPAGSARGGESVPADARVVLEVHDIDPANPGSLAAPSTVLFDGVLATVPAGVTYALVNSVSLHGTLTYTRIVRAVEALVRSAIPNAAYRTRLVAPLADGGECLVGSNLYFLPQYVPERSEKIVVSYRSSGRALARVTDPASISANARPGDDGLRGAVRNIARPSPRTSRDCEIAALALLDDSTQPAWAGEYQCWAGFLPAADVFPGDAVAVNAPSRNVAFTAIVREVEIEWVTPPSAGAAHYTVRFANDAAAPLAFAFYSESLRSPLEDVTATTAVGAVYLPELVAAEITVVSSTQVTIDAGAAPPAGGGIEVRRSDSGWNADNDRNLVGRFTARTFTVPRLSRTQDYYLRPYDSAGHYSRYSTLLHLDWPYT